MKILIATTNPGKKTELEEMLSGSLDGAHWLSLADLEGYEEVEEDGTTFEENSRKKALGYAEQSGLWTIADDSGLVIDALDGAPGVNSARFSGAKTVNEPRDLIDHRNIEKVLALMKDVPDEKRSCRFVCSLTLAGPNEVLAQTEGKLEGVITREETGSNGFGYDPIVYVPSMERTVAELSADEKNKVSHRSTAIKKMKRLLVQIVCEL